MCLFTDDFQKPNLKPKEIPSISKMKNVLSRENAPVVEFVVDPVDIIVSFYDYMPGSYNSNPLQLHQKSQCLMAIQPVDFTQHFM